MARNFGLAFLSPLLVLHCMPDFDGLKAYPDGSGGGAISGQGGEVSAGGATPAAGSGGTTTSGARSGAGSGNEAIGGGGAFSGGAGGSDLGGEGGVGGDPNTGGAGGADAGAGGTPPAEPPCGGCARLEVPIKKSGTAQGTLIEFSPVIDLTGATVVVRLRSPEPQGGAVQIYVQDDTFGGDYTFSQPLSSFPTLTDVSWTVPAKSDAFDPARVRQLVIALQATTPPWPEYTVMDIDSITFENAPAGAPEPYTFDSVLAPLKLHGYAPISGSILSWIP